MNQANLQTKRAMIVQAGLLGHVPGNANHHGVVAGQPGHNNSTNNRKWAEA